MEPGLILVTYRQMSLDGGPGGAVQLGLELIPSKAGGCISGRECPFAGCAMNAAVHAAIKTRERTSV
jgi:hypothetical protein